MTDFSQVIFSRLIKSCSQCKPHLFLSIDYKLADLPPSSQLDTIAHYCTSQYGS